MIDQGLSLTTIEKIGSIGADFDLGAGYPLMNISNGVQSLYASTIGLREFGVRVDLDSRLINAVLSYLHVRLDHAENTLITYSSSLSLGRLIDVIAAHGGEVIVTSPTIDIIPLLVSRRERLVLKSVVQDITSTEISIDKILEQVTADTRAIILCSPENPTGAVLSKEAILEIGQFCLGRNITLVIDQCFFGVVTNIDQQHFAADFLPAELKWATLWDTGKTFGFGNDKIGFAILSRRLRREFTESLELLQFSIPNRTKYFFLSIFESEEANSYIQKLHKCIKQNYKFLGSELDNRYKLLPLRGASFALLLWDRKETHMGSGYEFCNQLLRNQKVALLPFETFSAAEKNFIGNSYERLAGVRLALAREHEYFCNAFNRLRELL